jgi:4-hydroxybenzoate polyprenyltransferase
VPARFGERAGRWMPIVLHALMAAVLALAGILADAGWLYYAGVAAAIILTLYENRLYRVSENVFILNERIFTGNMAFSVVFLAATLGGYLIR